MIEKYSLWRLEEQFSVCAASWSCLLSVQFISAVNEVAWVPSYHSTAYLDKIIFNWGKKKKNENMSNKKAEVITV